ncbi:MAG: hypothetical protein KJ069_11385 [Anaerolineae bacterium]|nr:hypothetical protein [Anaerolineae bacterium]
MHINFPALAWFSARCCGRRPRRATPVLLNVNTGIIRPYPPPINRVTAVSLPTNPTAPHGFMRNNLPTSLAGCVRP